MVGSLTRIRNNQVYNSDINAATKIVPGSITGSLWNPILTYTGNLTVGNLFINGLTTSLDTVNVVSADPVIALNRNFSGANTYDVGLIIGRGNQTNTAMVWNESNKEFAFFYTSTNSLNSYYGTIPNTGYANIHASKATLDTLSVSTGNFLSVVTANISATAGYIDGTSIGTNSANVGAFTTISASGIVTANNTTDSTSYSTGGLVVAGGLGVSKAAWIHGNLTVDGNLLVTGNSVTFGSVDLTVTDSVINLHTFANLSPWTANDGKDIGFKFHYYDSALAGGDNLSFLGRSNDTGYLSWYTTGTEGVGNVFTSGTYGTIKTGEIILANSTTSTSTTTGAFRVTGGVGIGGNVNIGGNAVVNASGLNGNLIVQGNITSGYQNLLVTNGVTGQVGIKKSNNTLTPYSSFEVNATDSMILPTGLTGQRPLSGSEVKGMIRFNSSLNLIEFWDGTGWNTGAAAFTTILTDQFNGDGSTLSFTLAQNSTTAGTLVMINGVVQVPTVAYTVTNKILTFTEAPINTDLIDARTITTTASVTNITDGSTVVALSNVIPVIYATVRNSNVWVANTSTYFNGGISTFNANISLTQNTFTTVDTFSKTKFRSAKYIVTISDFANTKYQTAEVLVVHDGTTATATIFGVASTSTNFASYGAIVSGSNVLLQANSTSTASYASVQQIYNPV
jgi:hypothetical protein